MVVITSSEESYKGSCINIFHRIISCVMEAKAEFCHPIRPQFFLLDHTQSADYLNEDLFSMSDVDRVLASCDKNVVLSATGKRTLKRECLDFMRKLTLWNNLFPLDFASVLHKLKAIVQDLYRLGVNLPSSTPSGCHRDRLPPQYREKEDGTGEGVDELLPRPPMLVAPGTSPEANGLQSSGKGNRNRAK